MYIYIYEYMYIYISVCMHICICIYVYIHIIRFLSTLLIKKGSHRRYATLTTLAVVWALWSFKIFF